MSNLGPLSFSFNGTACTAHGVEVLRLPALTRPGLRQETISIPIGENGDGQVRWHILLPSEIPAQ